MTAISSWPSGWTKNASTLYRNGSRGMPRRRRLSTEIVGIHPFFLPCRIDIYLARSSHSCSMYYVKVLHVRQLAQESGLTDTKVASAAVHSAMNTTFCTCQSFLSGRLSALLVRARRPCRPARPGCCNRPLAPAPTMIIMLTGQS